MSVHNQKGSMIDFYNIRYFNQGDSTYNTAASLFTQSTGWATNTAVNELIARGIDKEKIVVGKAAASSHDPAAYMSASDLSNAIDAEYKANGWKTGVMIF